MGESARRQLVVFGDSLSDSGTFGLRFTTHPGSTWAEVVAHHLGCDVTPYLSAELISADVGAALPTAVLGGFNYAQGGARVSMPYPVASTDPSRLPWSAARQLDAFLHGRRRFLDSHIAVLFVGTNDVTYRYDRAVDPGLAEALRQDVAPGSGALMSEIHRVQTAAADAVELVETIRAAGARRVLVFETYNLGFAPWFVSDSARRYVSELAAAFNCVLRQGVRLMGDDVRLVELESMVNCWVAEPRRYGLEFGQGADACRTPGENFCTMADQQSPSASRDYLFAGSVHFSTAGHLLIARHVIRHCLRGWW